MTNPNPPTALPKSGRGVKIVLALSLALNLAVAGVFAGAAFRAHGDDGTGRRTVRDVNFSPFTEALTRDQRRAMLGRLSQGGTGLRDMRAQMRSDLDDVVAALRATPFDPAAVEAAFARQGARLSTRADVGRQALVGLLLSMSDGERAAFVARLEETRARHQKPPKKQ